MVGVARRIRVDAATPTVTVTVVNMGSLSAITPIKLILTKVLVVTRPIPGLRASSVCQVMLSLAETVPFAWFCGKRPEPVTVGNGKVLSPLREIEDYR